MIAGIWCSNLANMDCLDDYIIDDFLDNIMIEMRVIHEAIDYKKYNKKPTKYVD